jgi:hypothetical protein
LGLAMRRVWPGSAEKSNTVWILTYQSNAVWL